MADPATSADWRFAWYYERRPHGHEYKIFAYNDRVELYIAGISQFERDSAWLVDQMRQDLLFRMRNEEKRRAKRQG